MSREHSIQALVTFNDDWFNLLTREDHKHDGQITAVHMEDDPIDGKRTLNIFTDDGRGNGLLMLKIAID